MHIKQEITRDELEALHQVLQEAMAQSQKDLMVQDYSEWCVASCIAEIFANVNSKVYEFRKPKYKLKLSAAQSFAIIHFMKDKHCSNETNYVLMNGIIGDLDQKLTILTKGKRI